MATLNEIAYEIGYRKSRPNDNILRRRIKQLVISMRATLAERRFRKGMPIEGDYVQDLGAVPVIKVDKAEAGCEGLSVDCVILRTEDKIPSPVVTGSSSPFEYVGGLDKSTPYGYIPLYLSSTLSSNKFTSKIPRYTYRNGYVYIITFGKWSKAIKYVNISGVFADPTKAEKFNNCVGADCYTDDDRFPVPEDMVITIQDMVSERILNADASRDTTTGVTTQDI